MGERMFTDEEVREISGLKRMDGGDCLEVTCGCTSRRYGDAVGRLRVYSNGDLEILCECVPGCLEGLSLSVYTHTQTHTHIHVYEPNA